MNWLKKAKDAFARFKARAVKHQEVKQWGMNILNRLFEIVGIDEKKKRKREVVFNDDLVTEHLRAIIATEVWEPKEDIRLMEQCLLVLRKEAEDLTPVETGRLKDSIRTSVRIDKNIIMGIFEYEIERVFRVQNGRTVFYARAVHNRYAYHGQDKYPNNPPRATWKFLEIAFNNRYVRSEITRILNQEPFTA